MLKSIKSHWKRAISGLLAVVMMAGMFPASAFAADSSGGSNSYAPTGNFELNIAGATAWNGGTIDRNPMTVKNALAELETAGLIERQRRGFSSPNRIYVKIPDGQDIVRLTDKKLSL